LTIYRRDEQTLYVSNVVPREAPALSYEQYNVILEDFHETVLSRLQASYPITFMLGSDQLRIEDLMSPNHFRVLKCFARNAKRSTGSAHPADRERWYILLLALHTCPNRLTADALSRWLIEVEGWQPAAVHKLIEEFKFGMGLLAFEEGYHRYLAMKRAEAA
jgi:hypothetical protein